MNDFMGNICYGISQRRDMDSEFYLAFFIHKPDLPFTVGGSKADFYLLKDILDKVSFKGTTPLKYTTFLELSKKDYKLLKSKESVSFNMAMSFYFFCRKSPRGLSFPFFIIVNLNFTTYIFILILLKILNFHP